MFAIKGRYFKVEYKGLNILYLNYGKYGNQVKKGDTKRGDNYAATTRKNEKSQQVVHKSLKRLIG